MKKTFLIAVSAIGIFAGCAKNEIKQVDRENQSITYQTVVGKPETKAMIGNGLSYPTGVSFGSAAFLTDGEWADSYLTAGYYIEKSEVRFENNGWSTEETYFWPMDGVNLTFFSVSPWTGLAATEAVAIDQYNGVVIKDWDVSQHQDIDIMVADVAADQVDNTVSYNGWQAGVPTIFRHKLAQVVNFSVSTLKDYTAADTPDLHIFINKIAVKNIHNKGTYYSGNNVDGSLPGEWVKSDETVPYTSLVDVGEGLNGTEINVTPKDFPVSYKKDNESESQNYLLVLPQDFAASGGPQIEVTYTLKQFHGTGENDFTVETKTVDADLYIVHEDSHAWEMNRIYTYNLVIEISVSNDIYWAPSVYTWVDQTLGEYVLQ